MKALMSLGALVGALGLLLLGGMIFDVVPSNTVRLIEGYMPMQMLFEVGCYVLGFTGLSYMLNAMGMGIPRFWQGIGFWVFLMMYLKFRVYPPIPFSVRAMYHEPGMAFAGTYDDGVDDFYEYGDLSADEIEANLPADLDSEYGISEQVREWEQDNQED